MASQSTDRNRRVLGPVAAISRTQPPPGLHIIRTDNSQSGKLLNASAFGANAIRGATCIQVLEAKCEFGPNNTICIGQYQYTSSNSHFNIRVVRNSKFGVLLLILIHMDETWDPLNLIFQNELWLVPGQPLQRPRFQPDRSESSQRNRLSELEQTRLELEQTRLELKQSQSQLNQLLSQLEQSQSALKQSQSELNQLRSQLEQSQSERNQLRSQLNQLRLQLDQERVQHTREMSARDDIETILDECRLVTQHEIQQSRTEFQAMGNFNTRLDRTLEQVYQARIDELRFIIDLLSPNPSLTFHGYDQIIRQHEEIRAELASLYQRVNDATILELRIERAQLYAISGLFQCPICLEINPTAGSSTTACNHTFHVKCLNDAATRACPVCRAHID